MICRKNFYIEQKVSGDNQEYLLAQKYSSFLRKPLDHISENISDSRSKESK